MATTRVSISQTVLTLQVDLLTATPTAAISALGTNVVVVGIPMADRIRVVAYTGDASLFTGFFITVAGAVSSYTSATATDAGGPLATVTMNIYDVMEDSHYIWPVQIGTEPVTGQGIWWIRAAPPTDIFTSTSVSPYSDPWSSYNGLTPPSGYTSGILFPWAGDRVENTDGAGIPIGALGVVVSSGPGGVIVDWDDYANTTWGDPGAVTVVASAPGSVPAAPSITDAPVVSGATVVSVGNTSAQVSWTTDIPSTSRVEYGLTTGYGSVTEEDTALTLTHTVVITGLSLGATYHFRAMSANSSGYTGLSGDLTLTLNILWSTVGCTFTFAPEVLTINPQIALQWSSDGGFTWSSERWREMGKIGEHAKALYWDRLGRARDRVYRVSVMSPVKVVLVDTWIDMTEGTS